MYGHYRHTLGDEEMTNIRTTCTQCGDIELTHQDVRLELSAEWTTGAYCFTCPYCLGEERRSASQRVITILLAAGVTYEVIEDDMPISETEIREFVAALDREDWYAQLLAS